MKFKKRILKNYFIQKILAFLIAVYIYLVKVSANIKYENEKIPNYFWNNNKPFILAFWHSQLMTISFSWKSKSRINILASDHSDGRLGAMIGQYFKLNNIAINYNHKNAGLRIIYDKLKKNNFVGITPDGPRGPREIVSEGIIKIAKKTQIPIIPCGFWSSKNINLNSWDKFLVTLPFSKCCFYWNEPINVPSNLNENEIAKYQDLIKKSIDDCINKARIKIQ
tara:strand:- start:791 stop:1459 length:669 start_codon:yes stop_codon:yes gene_type:complete